MPFVTNPFPTAKSESWPETLLSNAPHSSNDSFRKPARTKSSKIPVATTPTKRACPECGTLLPEEVEFCPVCALRGALAPEKTESLSDISSDSILNTTRSSKTQKENRLSPDAAAWDLTYKAIDTHLRCPVALKIIGAQLIGNESAQSRFLREAEQPPACATPMWPRYITWEKAAGTLFMRWSLW
jgi:hypothetical protein